MAYLSRKYWQTFGVKTNFCLNTTIGLDPFYAITIYRLSHILWNLEDPILPRMMSEYAHGITGTNIHPGAQIGDSFFIDHATGIVIGQTAIVKNHVSIYQGVTLGGIQVSKEEAILMTNRLAREEGIFVGMSSGGATAIALKVAEQIDQGVIVSIICDRYLSSTLYDRT